MRRGKWRKINWRHIYQNAKDISSIGSLIKVSIELGENLLKLGRYNPDALLQDDSVFAGEVAAEYVRALLNHGATLLVIREGQNIDPESLKFFLSIATTAECCAVIFEYTAPAYKFLSEHEKVIFETISDKPPLVIYDLLKLKLEEFRYLLGKYVPQDRDIDTLVELKWDGNLRIIRELRYCVMVGNTGGTPDSLDVKVAIERNLAGLPMLRRLILAVVATHVEALGRDVLVAVLRRITPTLTETTILAELSKLADDDGYIKIGSGLAAIADEDLIEAVKASQSMLPVLKLSAVSLRDFYLEIVNGSSFANVRWPAALRQAVALCAVTGDIFALRNLVRTLDRSARQAHDQTLYVGIVADVALARANLTEIERRELVDWAAAAAYEAGDYATAAKLLESLSVLKPYDQALLACCYGEVNRHETAIAYSRAMTSNDPIGDVIVAAKLIECLSFYAIGKKHEARAMHTALRENTTLIDSPLFGFVLRFTEVVGDFPGCMADVLRSGDELRRSGLMKAAAYSQLAGAMHLAYSGQIAAARRLIAAATRELQPHVRDQSIILNNAVVVELLTERPDLVSCVERLDTALFTVGDDFSRLTLLGNRLICHALLADIDRGNHTIDVIERILAAPGFGNRDIFVTTCYNVWRFCLDTAQPEKAERFKSIALSTGLERNCYPNYWAVRFGLKAQAESEFDFLLRHRFHPDYLSHWLIDLEGLNVLKAAGTL
jgi:hypothetical protein